MASINGLVEIDCDFLNGIDATTISYLDATSSIQTQFNKLGTDLIDKNATLKTLLIKFNELVN